MHSPRILIVGNGAVGAVYGHHLALAGCHVRYLVRDLQSPTSKMPRRLHQYGLLGGLASTSQHLRVQTLADSGWDQIWLCLPSTALDSDWLKAQLARAGTRTPVVLWSPALEDKQRLQAHHAADITLGLIGLVSFQSPLPGHEEPSAGIAYLAPPRSAVLENTDSGRTAAQLLKRGGLSATTEKNLPALTARLSSLLITQIAALEINNWSLKSLRKSPWLKLAGKAAMEAAHVSETALGEPHRRRLPGQTTLIRAALQIAPALSPFPLEDYLRYHFGKVAPQTRLMIDTWLSNARQQGAPSDALTALREALP